MVAIQLCFVIQEFLLFTLNDIILGTYLRLSFPYESLKYVFEFGYPHFWQFKIQNYNPEGSSIEKLGYKLKLKIKQT